MIGDRERCLQAGMDDHITSACLVSHLVKTLLTIGLESEPLRRGDLLNSINKLAGERAQLAKQYHLLQRPPALMTP